MTTPQGTIYAHIERDNRLRWHPVIVVKIRGQQVFAATSLQGYMDATKAAQAGEREAERLGKGKR